MLTLMKGKLAALSTCGLMRGIKKGKRRKISRAGFPD